MVLKKGIHHPNDITNKYFEEVMPEKLKNYFNLPGRFKSNFPTKIFKRDGSEREMDWLMLVEPDNMEVFEEMLIHVEFQSYVVDKNKIEIIADCTDYAKIYYGRPVLTVIIITDGYELSQKEYKRTESDILKPIYIFMTKDEITERLNNLEKKINNQEQLSDNEALDMVFLPMFSAKDKAKSITEKIVHLFKADESLTGVFRNDIAFGISLMIRKYFPNISKAKELLKLVEPELISSRLRDVVDFEVDYIKRSYEEEISEMGDVIAKMSSALAEKDSDIAKLGSALAEKDSDIAKMGSALAEKDSELDDKNREISILKAKLKENGLD